MCLTIKSGPHIATEDLNVLKLVYYARDKSFTHFRGFPIDYNKLITSEIEFTPTKLEIERGLHSLIINLEECLYRKGFTNRNDMDPLVGTTGLALAIIPKDSTYYVGIYGDIVSNQLICIRPLSCAYKRYIEGMTPKNIAYLDTEKMDEFYFNTLKLLKKDGITDTLIPRTNSRGEKTTKPTFFKSLVKKVQSWKTSFKTRSN